MIDINAVADAPTLALTGSMVTSREVFRTGWETVANGDNTSTLLKQTTLEGWTLITSPDTLRGGGNGFEVWSAGDSMANNSGALRSVAADTANGRNWLELNDSGSDQAQTLGIQRSVQTKAGANYVLGMDLAGRLGYASGYTRIGVYVDGAKLATYDNTSGPSQLEWGRVSLVFTGTGGTQTLRIVTEATSLDSAGRGMMVDDIALTETTTPQREVFRTGFESAANPDNTSTLVTANTFEGWNLITTGKELAGGNNGFEVWNSGDSMASASGTLKPVTAAAGDGAKWLEINDAGVGQHQTLGIERSVHTEAGNSYTLSFEAAGRLGYGSAYTRIGVYVDGVKLGTVDNISSATSLAWQTLSYSFIGTGGNQTIRIVGESTAQDAGGRGMMIDDIALMETQHLNEGREGSRIQLQGVAGGLVDNDGSENLLLTLTGLPLGSVLSDGTRSFTATEAQRVSRLDGWDTSALVLTPPKGFSGALALQVQATAIERATGSRATTTQNLISPAVAADPTSLRSGRATSAGGCLPH